MHRRRPPAPECSEANAFRLQRVATDRRGKGRLQDLHVVAVARALGGVAQGELRPGRLRVKGKSSLTFTGTRTFGWSRKFCPTG